LGRLASFYPGCRRCPHRDDTGTLSPRQVRQLAETRPRGEARSVFHDEGAGGVYLNDLGPAVARDIAAAFGCLLLGEDRDKVHSQSEAASDKAIVLAGDGRPLTAELVAAASEGLRLSGCDVVDIGPATAACLAFAVDHLQAAGGILVGNPGIEPHVVGLKFWSAGGSPLSAGGSLEPLAQLYQTGVGRPTRAFGALRRFQAETPYLAALASHYHALRPLRVVLDSASLPLAKCLEELTAATACRVVLCRTTREELPKQVRGHAAHFAACIDGDGETCRVLDEQGRPVPAERLLLLLISIVGGDSSRRSATAPRSSATGVASHRLPVAHVVLEEGTPPSLVNRLERYSRGLTAPGRPAGRSAMATAMRQHGAILGGGPSGRFWHTGHAAAGLPLPDALMTVTLLLELLSRTDDPLSVVLDREAAIE
jgi:phosphomannomutase